MRVAIVADVHANLAALEAVLAAAERTRPIDQVWCLGDLVGYGPKPCECIALLRRYPHICLAGNHDRAAVGLMTTEEFNPLAAAALTWTAGQLGEDERAYLTELDSVVIQDEFTLVHGSLREPLWEYLVSEEAASAHFALQSTPYGLVGHSHLPLGFWEERGLPAGRLLTADFAIPLEGRRLIANPGSVGQPRDGDPRASYGLLDTGSMRFSVHRAEYDISATQRAMAAVGLPEYLVRRLAQGR